MRRTRATAAAGALGIAIPLVAAVPPASAQDPGADDPPPATQDNGSPLLTAGFEDGTTQGWGPRGSEEEVTAVDTDARSGDWSLRSSGRTESWNGPSRELTDVLEPETTYEFSLWLKLASGEDPADLRVSVQRDLDGESTFETVVPDTTVTDSQWVEFAGEYTMASEADAIHLYAESAEALVDIHLDDFTLAAPAPPEIEDIPPLREVLADEFQLGVAIDERETVGAPAELLNRHFGAITAENAMKAESIQPTEGEFTFGEADQLVDFANENDLRIYGHTLVWHSQTPDWFFEDENGEPLTDSPEDRQLALDRMQTHIEAMAERYGDDVWAFDVVNEAIDDSQDDNLRRTPWYEIIGPDYLAHAFQFARDAFGPDVKLFLNDYNTEFPAKRDAMFEVIQQLRADGVPVDGVGHQFHLDLVRSLSWADDTIAKFRELDIEQAVTELDVSIAASSEESLPEPPPERVAQQGYYYRDLFEILRGHSDVLSSVTAWGLYDARSWLRDDTPHEAPLFFDDDLQAKPAYWGVVDPSQLPHLPRTSNVPQGTPEVDGERELLWNLLPDVVLQGGEEGIPATGFQVRWDEDNLHVLAEVAAGEAHPDDRVEIYVDDDNAKEGEYQDDDARYALWRDGATAGGPAASAVTETADGYRVEAALPLASSGEQGRDVGFDIRITDGTTGEQVSWSDQNHSQDDDTTRWGTVALVEPRSHVDIPYALVAPDVDAERDPVWDHAGAVTADTRVQGAEDGATGEMRMLWDEQRLYMLADVTDDQLDEEHSNAWEHDSVEIFVNPGNTKTGAYQPEDGQYRVSFTNHQSVSGDLSEIGDNLTSAATVTDDGYRIEASIELPEDTTDVEEFLGLDFQINDATDGSRTSVHTWHDPTGQSYQDTSRWGVGRLTGPPMPECDTTVADRHAGPLTATGETLCLTADAHVLGPVTVADGGSLLATGATVTGPVTVTGGAYATITDSAVRGPLTVTGATDRVDVSGTDITGPVTLTGNTPTLGAPVVADNQITGPLTCRDNDPAPTQDPSNVVRGPSRGQCA